MTAGLFLGLLLSISLFLGILLRQRQENILNSTIIAATNCSVLVTDATLSRHPIVYVNPAFLLLTGYAEEEVLGQTTVGLDRPGYRSGLARKACDGPPRWMGLSRGVVPLPQERHLILE